MLTPIKEKNHHDSFLVCTLLLIVENQLANTLHINSFSAL